MIHLARDGAQLGQFTLDQVNDMLAAGQLKTTDLCWKEGLSGWIPLSGLEGVPGSAASPLPAAHASQVSAYTPPQSVVSGSFHQPGGVPPGSIQALKETRPWVLFLAILGCIGTGLMVLAALGMLLAGTAISSSTSMPAGFSYGMMAGMSVAYLVLGLLYLYPIVKLLKYSGAIKRLIQSGAAADLDEALQQQKSFWKFVGIVAIIMMVLYPVLVVLMIIGGFNASSMGRTAPSVYPAPTSSP